MIILFITMNLFWIFWGKNRQTCSIIRYSSEYMDLKNDILAWDTLLMERKCANECTKEINSVHLNFSVFANGSLCKILFITIYSSRIASKIGWNQAWIWRVFEAVSIWTKNQRNAVILLSIKGRKISKATFLVFNSSKKRMKMVTQKVAEMELYISDAHSLF